MLYFYWIFSFLYCLISLRATRISFRTFTTALAEGKNNNINYIFFFLPTSAIALPPSSQTICKNEKLLKTTTVTGKNLSICRKEAPVCLILYTFWTQLLILKWLFGWKKGVLAFFRIRICMRLSRGNEGNKMVE